MKKIVIASKNLDKIKEMRLVLQALPVEILSLADFSDMPDAIEDGATFEENALIKARFFAECTGLACLADDSGLEVDALNGLPGVYSARFAGYHADDGTNNQKLLDELNKIGVTESKADYRCALAFRLIARRMLRQDLWEGSACERNHCLCHTARNRVCQTGRSDH